MTNDSSEHSNHAPDTSSAGGSLSPSAPEPSWMLRAGLVVVACVMTWYLWDGARPSTLASLDHLGDGLVVPWLGSSSWGGDRLTEEERFLFEGDKAREVRHEQQRAIWERDPTNRVYLGNYISSLAAGPGQETNQLDYVRQELAAAREVDPDNARIDYLEAAWLLRSGAKVESEPAGEDENGKKLSKYSLEIGDREAVEEAMRLLQQGTEKPEMRRYSAEMLQKRLEVLGPPRRFLELVQRVGIAASTLLPDLAQYRMLTRASRLYAEELIAEGRTEEALPLLEVWRPMTVHLAEDSFTLIDVLVVGVLAADAEKSIPPIFQALGREAEAERVQTVAGALARPVTVWRERRQSTEEADVAAQDQGERVMMERGSILMTMLLPALAIWPSEEEFRSGRMLEYAVGTQMLLAILCAVFLAGMLICLALVLRWRFWGGVPAGRPLLLLPDLRALARILALGVVVPVALFFLVTRLLPWSGHAYSFMAGGHKLIAEAALLVLALIVVPICMTAGYVRQRSEQLGVKTTTWYASYLIWPILLAAVFLVCLWFCPADRSEVLPAIAGVAVGIAGAALGVGLLLTMAQGIGGQSEFGQFYGTSFRTLIPVLALVIIVLGVLTKPYLVAAEARYLAEDTLLNDPGRPGFTRVENDLTERLRGEILVESDRQRE